MGDVARSDGWMDFIGVWGHRWEQRPALGSYSTISKPYPKTTQLQYEQAEILNRVGVRLLEASAGEDGWEVRCVCV